MLCLYLLGQNCLHLTFKPYLSSETHSRKYEKLPNINSCMWTYWRKNDIVKMSGPQILLSNCLFTFRPIASEQLNSLTTIDTLSWLGGAVVTHPLWVQDVPSRVQFQAPARVLFDVLFYCCCDFPFCNTSLYFRKFCNSFCNVDLFSILNILQDLWPIIRV